MTSSLRVVGFAFSALAVVFMAIPSPVAGIYIRYTTDEALAAKESEGTSYDLEAQAMLDVSGNEEDLLVKVTGAVRYPCFVSGEHDNQDFAHMLENYPGYKIAAICRNVWVDLPRRNAERSGLEDIEVWAALFDSSYGKAFEVGPSLRTRTTRLTHVRIPGVEPGYPTRMGRMSTVEIDDKMGDLTADAGMTAHKVGHGTFGSNYAWARAIGTGTEFRANQMPGYENYKTGKGAGARGGAEGTEGIRNLTIAGKSTPYDAYNIHTIIRMVSKFLSTPGHSYFINQGEAGNTKSHSGGGAGGAHQIFLYCKWQHHFHGVNGIDVWAKMNKDFADDIKAAGDDDPETNPSFPLRKGDANTHAEDHAVRWADISGFNIIPYFEVFGFEISDETKNHPVIKDAQPWLPMGSPYFNSAEVIRENATAVFDFDRADENGMTLALTSKAEAVIPEFLGLQKQPAFGSLAETTSGVYTYTPNPDAQGRDSFAYKVRHPETKQEQTVTVYIDVIGPTKVLSPEDALKLYGRGPLVEVLQAAEGDEQTLGKKRGRRRGDSGIPRVLDESRAVLKSRIAPQSFKTRLAGGDVRMRAYLEAPQSGEYTFWIRAKDGVELRMNTEGSDPAGASLLLQDGTTTNGQTDPIPLVKGQRYYMDLYRPRGGEVAVGWSRAPKAEGPEELVPAKCQIPVGKPISIVPIDDVAQGTANKPLIIDALANDRDYRFTDPSNRECLHLHYVGQTENGKTELINNNQQIKYTPNPGFKGTDKFQYGIQSKTYRDGMQVGSVTVNVD